MTPNNASADNPAEAGSDPQASYRFAWHATYDLKESRLLPKGTRLVITGHFDNSANNTLNPDPERPVRWGEASAEEMMDALVDYVDDSFAPPNSADLYTAREVGES